MTTSADSVSKDIMAAIKILNEAAGITAVSVQDVLAVCKMIAARRSHFTRNKAYRALRERNDLEPLLREACELLFGGKLAHRQSIWSLASDALREWHEANHREEDHE